MGAEDAVSLKARADASFRGSDFAEAVALYGAALDAGSAAPHLLHANRSTAALRCGDAALAVADALACVRLDASYVKGFYRLGAALLKAGWVQLALQAFLLGSDRQGKASAEMSAGIAEVCVRLHARLRRAVALVAAGAAATRGAARACTLASARRGRRGVFLGASAAQRSR